MPGKLLLFDVDATLIRTGGAGMRAMSRAFEKVMGWKNALAGITMAGMTDPGIAHMISLKQQGRGLKPSELEQLFASYLLCLPEELSQTDQFRVLPGIQNFLEVSSQAPHLGLGLGTGNIAEGARIKLQHGNLFHFFRFGGYGSDAEERSALLVIAVERGRKMLGEAVPLEQVVVIGDTPHDIAAGKAIGARTIGVATGPYSLNQLQHCQPDLALEDFTAFTVIQAFLKH